MQILTLSESCQDDTCFPCSFAVGVDSCHSWLIIPLLGKAKQENTKENCQKSNEGKKVDWNPEVDLHENGKRSKYDKATGNDHDRNCDEKIPCKERMAKTAVGMTKPVERIIENLMDVTKC